MNKQKCLDTTQNPANFQSGRQVLQDFDNSQSSGSAALINATSLGCRPIKRQN